MLRMQAWMGEGVADHRVLQTPAMPGGRQPHQGRGTAGRVVHAALHLPTLAAAHPSVKQRPAQSGDRNSTRPDQAAPEMPDRTCARICRREEDFECCGSGLGVVGMLGSLLTFAWLRRSSRGGGRSDATVWVIAAGLADGLLRGGG